MTQVNMAGRPLYSEFKPFSKNQLNDPYPILARARREQPVFYSPELDLWVVTRYDDVDQVYREFKQFSNAAVLSLRSQMPAQIVKEFGDRQLPLTRQLVMSDPPVHTRLKKLMMPAFTTQRIAGREDWIRELTHRLIDEFEANMSADLLRVYTSRIPTAVIGKIIGVPEEDARHFAKWTEDLFVLVGAWDVPEEVLIEAWRGVFAFDDYVRALIADRRQKPQDDLTSDFIHTVSDDGSAAMSDEEVLHNVFNVAAAGSDTTGVLIAHLIHLLLTNLQAWEEVRKDRSLIPGAVEETMRFRSPVRGLLRKTTAEVRVGEVTVPPDSFVFIHLASANRDTTIFEEADRFDIHRRDAIQHAGFGRRTHSCVGAGLARLEARIAIETLMDRLPTLELTDGQMVLEYMPNLMLPAIKSLQARW